MGKVRIMNEIDIEKISGVYLYKPIRTTGRGRTPFNPERCAQSVHDSDGWGIHQCYRKAKVEEAGFGWCNQHLPSNVKAKHEKWLRDFRAKYDLIDAKREANTRHHAIAKAAIEYFNQRGPFDAIESAFNEWRLAADKLESLENE